MILLDTNVVSEAWRPAPDPRALDWMNAQAVETLHLSAVTIAELRFGIAVLPPGRRRTMLDQRLETDLLPVFAGRVLPFDLDASRAYATVMAAAKAAGRMIGLADGYIAAIAIARGFAVATRDVNPFEVAGVEVIDPWRAV